MENLRFISELTTKTSICSVTCSVFSWFSHVFPCYSHYPCLMGPHDAWGGLPLSGEAIMRKSEFFFNGFIYNVYCIYIYESGLRIPGPPPMVWSPKLTPPPQWYGPPSSRSRERGTRDHACMHASMHPSIHPSIHTYRHTHRHTYLSTYLPTYLHTYIPTYLRTYIHTHIHTYIPTYIPTYQHTNIPTYQHNIPPPQATGGGTRRTIPPPQATGGGTMGGRGGAWESWVIYIYMYDYVCM